MKQWDIFNTTALFIVCQEGFHVCYLSWFYEQRLKLHHTSHLAALEIQATEPFLHLKVRTQSLMEVTAHAKMRWTSVTKQQWNLDSKCSPSNMAAGVLRVPQHYWHLTSTERQVLVKPTVKAGPGPMRSMLSKVCGTDCIISGLDRFLLACLANNCGAIPLGLFKLYTQVRMCGRSCKANKIWANPDWAGIFLFAYRQK